MFLLPGDNGVQEAVKMFVGRVIKLFERLETL